MITALSPLEVASGLILRPRRRTALPKLPGGTTPRLAFEAAILPALQRGPCLVSFSGGRDSSAVLAAAAHVARREGLPLPVPATHRFPDAQDTRECEWQEQVVRHLRLDDWHRIDVTDEFDCVGPVAVTSLRRHGPLFPCNAYFHLPIFEAAAGGSVLTGVGGDEAFSPSSWARPLAVLRGRARPARRDLLDVPFALAPTAVKRRLIAGSLPTVCPWLRPAAQRAVQASIAAGAAEEPLRWRTRFARTLGSAYMEVALASLAALARDCDVEVRHPLHDAGFLASLAALPGNRRFSGRSEAMAMLVGDLLEPELVGRATKARFDAVFWTHHSRALVEQWNGEAVDPELVDLDRLRAEWRSPTPDSHTCTLLQSVWLASGRGQLQEPLGARR
jgi:asparagine synthetase B (glutamine-hydrolysing)